MLLVPAIQTQGTSPANVQATPGMVVFGTPGGRNGNEGRLQVDGLGVGAARNGGGVSGYNADIANAQEISFTVSAGLGEAEVSGPTLSVVPKTGGNACEVRCSSPASARAWSAATTRPSCRRLALARRAGCSSCGTTLAASAGRSRRIGSGTS